MDPSARVAEMSSFKANLKEVAKATDAGGIKTDKEERQDTRETFPDGFFLTSSHADRLTRHSLPVSILSSTWRR